MSNELLKLEEDALELRKAFESVPWHTDIPTVWTPEHTISNIVPGLAKGGFDIGWWISYDEKFTIIDARRGFEIGTSGELKGKQLQLHARARVVKDNGNVGLQWAVHVEPSPITSPGLHYGGKHVDWPRGQSVWVDIAPSVGLSPEAKDPSWSVTPIVNK